MKYTQGELIDKLEKLHYILKEDGKGGFTEERLADEAYKNRLRELTARVFNEETVFWHTQASPHCPDFFEGTIADALVRLPRGHEVSEEISAQAKENLLEILTKSYMDLKEAVPRYINSFRAGEFTSNERIYPEIKKAAYHVLEQYVKNKSQMADDSGINTLFNACSAMGCYGKTYREEVLKFLEECYKHKFKTALVINLVGGLKDERAIDMFLEAFTLADGKEDFELSDGIKRGVNFKFVGRRLNRAFPNYNFVEVISKVQNQKLQRQLTDILINAIDAKTYYEKYADLK